MKKCFCSALLLGLTTAMLLVLLPQAEARAFYVFGDSLVDSGNNNYFFTLARADAYPYGIDYPTHKPTGRFSNGLNIADLIGESIGAEATLPYLSPELRGQKLLVGANFASAGIGILNDTGFEALRVIRITQQLEYFSEYQQRVTAFIGSAQTKRLVNQALVLISLGANDIINNYYLLPFSVRSYQFTLPDFVRYIISEYKKILLKLHDLGAHRVLVTGTGFIACLPAILAQRGTDGGCSAEVQRAADIYNPQLAHMINQVNCQLGSNVFIAVNINPMVPKFISNPQKFGFITSKIACCGLGPYNGLPTCTRFSNLCPDRDLYVFWDAYHPSEKANRLIVQEILSEANELMHPMNLTSIMALDSKT